jgi:hypothetical protein
VAYGDLVSARHNSIPHIAGGKGLSFPKRRFKSETLGVKARWTVKTPCQNLLGEWLRNVRHTHTTRRVHAGRRVNGCRLATYWRSGEKPQHPMGAQENTVAGCLLSSLVCSVAFGLEGLHPKILHVSFVDRKGAVRC